MPEPVPTVADLCHIGLAWVHDSGKGEMRRYHVTPEGHRLMGEAMRRNAQEARRPGANRD